MDPSINTMVNVQFATLNTFVEANSIEMPSISRYERYHMNECETCRKALLYHGFLNISTPWDDLDERARAKLAGRGERAANKLVTKLCKSGQVDFSDQPIFIQNMIKIRKS